MNVSLHEKYLKNLLEDADLDMVPIEIHLETSDKWTELFKVFTPELFRMLKSKVCRQAEGNKVPQHTGHPLLGVVAWRGSCEAFQPALEILEKELGGAYMEAPLGSPGTKPRLLEPQPREVDGAQQGLCPTAEWGPFPNPSPASGLLSLLLVFFPAL